MYYCQNAIEKNIFLCPYHLFPHVLHVYSHIKIFPRNFWLSLVVRCLKIRSVLRASLIRNLKSRMEASYSSTHSASTSQVRIQMFWKWNNHNSKALPIEAEIWKSWEIHMKAMTGKNIFIQTIYHSSSKIIWDMIIIIA